MQEGLRKAGKLMERPKLARIGRRVCPNSPSSGGEFGQTRLPILASLGGSISFLALPQSFLHSAVCQMK
ncbi:hypothetical protein V6N12_029929 [Hibiscus sabdariffa]|uniref:Uncharacterized protein n=1 Tax=Hibiscus sabdariffa TaxID=183260 RepID=A0ABR2CXN3_9ROSI